jgi:hypothetical protein
MGSVNSIPLCQGALQVTRGAEGVEKPFEVLPGGFQGKVEHAAFVPQKKP